MNLHVHLSEICNIVCDTIALSAVSGCRHKGLDTRDYETNT